MAQSKEYWDKRALQRLTDSEKISEEYINRIKKVYSRAYRNIEDEIRKVYINYSKETGLDIQKLKELLTKKETDKVWQELKKQGLDKYIKDNYKARISNLEKIQAQIYAKAKQIYPKEELEQEMCYKDVINDSYYKAIYDTQMGTGYDFSFNKIDSNLINALLDEKWSSKNYSVRIWKNTDILAGSISEIVGGGILSGQSIEKTSRQLRERFNCAKYYAERLVRTETNHFHNEADAMAYEEMGVKKYVFVSVLDNRTSEICQSLDKKLFEYKDKQTGINFPPMHVNCRSKTRGYISEEVEKMLVRRARNPITGKNEEIGNISYNEWYDKNVNKYGKEKVETSYKMIRNKTSDIKQYEKYIKVLGRHNMPETLEKWQDLKYNNIKEYRLTKYNYKLRNEVIHNPQNIISSINIAEEKYTKYLFDGTNEKGLIKGKLISDVLGYNKNNYNEFDKLVKDNINKFPSRYKGTDQYGDKYEVNMVLKGLIDRQAKLTVGVRLFDREYKLTSMYINELKESELKYGKE